MRTIGLVGGIGPESTIDYYRSLHRAFDQHGTVPPPGILINSIDVRHVLAPASSGPARRCWEASTRIPSRRGA